MIRTAASSSFRRRSKIIGAAAFGLLAAPICVYIYVFGWHISDNHARWAEMGSAMSGLFTPILSLLTLGVLAAQVRLQGEMNKHAFDQAYVEEARSDVHYYLSQLVSELAAEFDNGSVLRAELVSSFAYASVVKLRDPECTRIARALDRKFPRVISLWGAFYPVLEGLRVNSHPPYEHNFGAAKQKAIALLSFEVCIALDNLVWCASEGQLRRNYQFSSSLPSVAGED